MNTWLSFISLLLTVAAGLAVSHRRSTLRLYFWAELLNAPVVFAGAHYLGDHDTFYALLYVAVTLPILECCCFMALEAGLNDFGVRVAVAFGLFVGMVASFGMPHHPPIDYVTFAEGVLLAMIAVAMLSGKRVAWHGWPIAALLLALSSYDFGWLRNESWSTLNDWLPSAMSTLAFIVIAAWGFVRMLLLLDEAP